MISTRVMDMKLREATEGLGEDGTGKKKSKFKTFKRFFGKKKRKEAPSPAAGSAWRPGAGRRPAGTAEPGAGVGDSEDELEESRGMLGSRALSHDSIFFPESGQDPARPVRVFSQENVCDRIKALQLKIQCNVKMGPPPPPGGLPAKRGDDAGMSSEDDGLPRSPPEVSLLHDTGLGTTIKVSLVSSSQPPSPDQPPSELAGDTLGAPPADFSQPPGLSSCLDSSAAKHKLLVKPRNQRSSKLRRLSSRAQSESLSDLTCPPEEEEEEERGGEQPDGGPEPGGPVAGPGPGDTHARRARLRHCPALSASTEEEVLAGGEPCSRPATPEDTEPVSDPAPRLETPPRPEDPPQPGADPRDQGQDTAEGVGCAPGDTEQQLSACTPEGAAAPPETVPTAPPAPGPGGPDRGAQKEAALSLDTPSPEGAPEASPTPPAPGPQPPKSCLKPKAPSASLSLSPAPLTSESPQGAATPCPLDPDVSPPEVPPAEQAQSPRGGPERQTERGGREPRGMKKFSVSSGRLRPLSGSSHLPEGAVPAATRPPLLKSGPAWSSEAAPQDLQGLPEPQSSLKGDPGERDTASTPATSGRGPATPEPPTQDERNPFPVKLRSTSLSFRYRAGSSPEQKGMKRYSAEVRLEKGGLALLSKDDKCPAGAVPGARGARSPSSQGRVKARLSELPGSKPPLPRKPLLQTFTLPQPPTAPHAGPGQLDSAVVPADSRKENRVAEKKLAPRAAEKGPSPAAAGPGAAGQPVPAWVIVARQKRQGAPEQPPTREDGPRVCTLKSDVGQRARATERVQEPTKQADFVRSKSFLIAPAKPTVERKPGAKFNLKEGLQRGISLSHQNLAAQSAAMMEKELSQLKRASYASADQPSWMELARKKSQAWSDMPQIIK